MRKLPGLVPKFVISRSRLDRQDVVSVRGALVWALAKVVSKRRCRALRYSSVLRRPATETPPWCIAAINVAVQYGRCSSGVKSHYSKRRSDRPSLTSTVVTNGVAKTYTPQRLCADAVTKISLRCRGRTLTR